MATNPNKVVLVTKAAVQPQIDALKSEVSLLHSQMKESNGKLDAKLDSLLEIIKKDLEAKLLQDAQGSGAHSQSMPQASGVVSRPRTVESLDLNSRDQNQLKSQTPGPSQVSLPANPATSGVEAPSRMEVEDSASKQVSRAKRSVEQTDAEIFDSPLPASPKKRKAHKPSELQVRDPSLSDEASRLLDVAQSEYDQSEVLEVRVTEEDMGELLDELDGEANEENFVADGLSKLVQGSYRRRLVPKLVEEFHTECPAPDNCTHLKVPDVNLPIWTCMSRHQRYNDLSCRAVQNELSVAGAEGVKAIAALSALKADADGDHTKQEIKRIMNMVGKAVALMGSASHGVSIKRRKDIKPCLNPQLQSLCADNTPVSENWLFGDDLQYQIREIQDARRLAHQVGRAPSHSFSHRGRSRGARGRDRNRQSDQQFRNQVNSQQVFPNRSQSRGQNNSRPSRGRGRYRQRRGSY